MIARRLRPIGWVAGVAAAALSLYLVSLQVAAERTALERVERRILVAHRQIRQLETEFSARASLRQLEAYNDDVLALSAPTTKQYLADEVQLASYAPEGGATDTPRVALASATPAARPVFRPALVQDAGEQGAPVIPAISRSAIIQTVAMIGPVDLLALTKPRPAAKTPAVQKVAMLDPASLGEIARRAAKEAKARSR